MITLYQNTRNPRLIFTRTFRSIREQPSTEGHPTNMFLRILPPQDTPHDFIHAHQMAFKTHPDGENIPWCFIPVRPHKRTDSVDMHRNFRKTIIYLSAYDLWHHTCTIRIYHHQWGINRPWERSPLIHVMGRVKPTVASSTLTPHGRLHAFLWPTIQCRPFCSEYLGKGGLNGWLNWWHHHHYHWQPTLGGARQERIFIYHPHHIQTSELRQTPETRWPPLTLQSRRRRSACQAQDLSGMGYPDPLSTVIPTAIKGYSLGTWHQVIPSFKPKKQTSYNPSLAISIMQLI